MKLRGYTGHFNLALKLADDVWPSSRPGLAKFKNEFSEALHESIYWKDYNALLENATKHSLNKSNSNTDN